MTTKTIQEHKTRGGEAFRVNVTKNIAADGTLTLQLQNPSQPDVKYTITDVKVTMLGPFAIRRPVQPSVTAGTETAVHSKRFGYIDSTAVNAYIDSTYTEETDVEIEYVGKDDSQPGEVTNSFGGENNDTVGILMNGSSFLIEVQNRSSTNAYDASITADFYETS